jgi:hypothetical protein
MSLWRNKGGKEMILPIDLLLLLFLLIIAVAALWVKDLLAAIVLMGSVPYLL